MEIGVGVVLYAADFVKPDWRRYKAVDCILERFFKVLLYWVYGFNLADGQIKTTLNRRWTTAAAE